MAAAKRTEIADSGGREVGRAPTRGIGRVWGRAFAGALSAGGLAAASLSLALVLAAPAASAGATTTAGKSVKISTAKVSGVGTVLTTASGLTLYRFTKDSPGVSTCSGACAKIWPPLLAAKGAHVSAPHGVKGFSLLSVGKGHWQVAFHKLPLYRFAGDTKKGQAHGQNVAGEWFAVLKSGIPAGAAVGTSGAGATSTPTTAPGATTTQPPVTPTTQGAGATMPAATPTPVTQPPTPAAQPTSPPATTPTTTPAPPPTTTPTTAAGSGGYGY